MVLSGIILATSWLLGGFKGIWSSCYAVARVFLMHAVQLSGSELCKTFYYVVYKVIGC